MAWGAVAGVLTTVGTGIIDQKNKDKRQEEIVKEQKKLIRAERKRIEVLSLIEQRKALTVSNQSSSSQAGFSLNNPLLIGGIAIVVLMLILRARTG